MQEYNQPTNTPVPKVAAAGVAGAAATVLIFLFDMAGIDLEPATAAALVTVAAFLAGYFKKDVK